MSCAGVPVVYTMSMAEQQNISPEEEIRKLEQQLERKRRELMESGTVAPEEKEIFREVLKEHIESLSPVLPQVPMTPHAPPPNFVTPTPQDADEERKKRELDEAIVRVLVEKAMTGTVESAVKEAQKISPYMIDELHDHLVDDMYDKLVALRKIKQL